MKVTDLLWIMVWMGIYSSTLDLHTSEFLNSLPGFIRGIRSILPLLAITLCLLKVVVTRFRKFPSLRTPLEFLFYYAFVGLVAAVLSPEIKTSLYWGCLYLSPIIVIWQVMNSSKPFENIQRIIIINYIIFTILTFSFMPQISGSDVAGWNSLPFGLGEVNRNGIGRYAIVIIIFSFVRFINQKKNSRFLYLFILLPALYVLAHSQSRSALLGLAVVTAAAFYIKGLNWRFLFIAPAFSYIIWLAGYQWRSGGNIDELVSLTGRDYTWQRGLEQIIASPIYGWGFQADRLLLEFEHMHNSYLHALIQSGIVGGIFFVGAIIGIWRLILRNNFFKKVLNNEGINKYFVVESICIITFLTARSFFESTAAFYGIDLLLLVTHICYLQLVVKYYLTPQT